MKYRKKTVVIEAFQYGGDLKCSDGQYYVPEWAVKAYEDGTMYYGELDGQPGELFIKTLDGVHHASVGDYIIQNVDGEIYPCKPDIFAKTYEAASAEIENPKIMIESNGVNAKVLINGKPIKCTGIDIYFHADTDGGINIKFNGSMIKEDKNGHAIVENDEIIEEKFHYDSRESQEIQFEEVK